MQNLNFGKSNNNKKIVGEKNLQPKPTGKQIKRTKRQEKHDVGTKIRIRRGDEVSSILRVMG